MCLIVNPITFCVSLDMSSLHVTQNTSARRSCFLLDPPLDDSNLGCSDGRFDDTLSSEALK